MTKFKIGQVWKTRDGDKAVIVKTTDDQIYPIHAYVDGKNNNPQIIKVFRKNGTYLKSVENGFDLISEWKEPETVTRYLVIGPSGNILAAYDEETTARSSAAGNLMVVKLDVTYETKEVKSEVVVT